jgi:hypothetical protein
MRPSLTLDLAIEASERRDRAPSGTGAPPRWVPASRKGDVLAAVCLVAFTVAGVLLLRVGVDSLDDGYFVEQAVRVLHGQLPYRDFDSWYTPGLLYVHAALIGLIGDQQLVAVRAAGLVSRVCLAVGLYLLCRPLTRPLFALLPALYVMIGLDRVPEMWEPHPGWPSAALSVLTVLAFSRMPTRDGNARRLRLVAIGGLTGLTFAFKQNAGAFLLLALLAFSAWRGDSGLTTPVTRGLRVVQILLLLAVLLFAAWLIHPLADAIVAAYLIVPLAAAGIAALGPVPVARRGRGVTTWLRTAGLLVLGGALVSVPWLSALLVALDGRSDLLKAFVGSVDQTILWHAPVFPRDGAWACLLGIAIAALLAIRVRRRLPLLAGAVLCMAAFAVCGVLLTGESGEPTWLALLMAPGRAAIGWPALLPVACIVAGAWQSLRRAPTRSTWQLRWLTVAGAFTFLTQYPRMDDVHLVWSAGIALATGAVVLGLLYARLAERWALGSVSQTALCAVLIVTPLLTVLPGVDERVGDWIRPAPAGMRPPTGEPTTVEADLPHIGGLTVTGEQYATLVATIHFVRANTTPGEPILVYPSSPLIYVAADRPNPTRFAHLYPGIASAEQIEQIIATLDQQRVRMVVVSDADLNYWGPPGVNQPLEAYIARNYHDVARFGAARVLLHD